MGKGTVLVIDDERDLVNLVRYNLESEGYEVLGALDGESGLNLALTRSPDLILLDRMMPGPDGVEVCRRLRQEGRTAHVPVIMLTAKVAEEERVQGLDAGADDYVTKPFSVRELLARVRARLRRAPGPEVPAIVRNGDLIVNETRREVTYGGRPVTLSPAEFRILQFLAACPGRVMFRRSAPAGELLLGSLACRHGMVRREQIREVLAIQDRDPTRKMGELLFERYYLSSGDLDRLLDLQTQAFGGPDNAGEMLGRLIVARRLATEFQVRDALRLQGRMVEAGLSPPPRLGEILVKRGVLSREALAAALELQNFMHYRCPQCGARIGLHPEPQQRAPVICPQCRAEVPQLFAKMASAIHHVLDEATEAQAVEIPEEVLSAAEDPKRQFGKYVLIGRIGQGGAGVVYRAWQRDCNRIVALKQLVAGEAGPQEGKKTPYGHAESVKRFFTEARAISELDHPNIVPLYDYGIAEQTFYYTMPLIAGGSLEALLHGPSNPEEIRPAHQLPMKFCLSVVRAVAWALDYAHQRGVVHRDVKPGNILIDPEQKPWLIDFGLAKVMRLGDPAYLKGIVLGTPYYMPPEQAVGDMEQVDARSDIYSLGAVLYELLSGIYPYAGMESDIVFAELMIRPPEALDRVDPEIPADLCRIVRTAMAREKKDRYAHAGELADEIDEYLKGIE